MAYTNNNGQVRIGVRAAIVNSPITQPTISASLLQSLYGVWNGDTTTNELGTSLYGVWNGEYSGTASLSTSLYGVWNGESTTNTLDTSLYALYKAEGNANDSVGTNHGTLLNGATFSTGKIGTKSFYFDGVNDYISLPNNSLNFTGDFSISVWVDVSSISSWSHSFDVINNLSGNYGWRLVINGNAYYFEIGNGTSITQLYFNAAYDSIAQIAPLIGSAMKNVVITRKAGVGTKMYINGVLKASNNSIVNPSYLATMTPKFGDGNTINKLDNIGFWNKELSNLEAIQLYNNNVGIDYPFNGNLLQSTNDVFGSNHGTLMNGTTFTTGKIGNAFSFDGVNDYVELPSTSLRMTGDFTISCWFYMNTQSTYNAFVENFYGINVSNRYGWALYYQSGKIRFGTYNVSTAITVGSTTITTGQWYHLVVTKTTTGSPKIYLNGVLESSTVNAGPTTLHPIYNSNNIPRFGVDVDAGGWGGYLNGRLDSVNVWNRELSANEVSMLYNGSNGTQYSSGSFGLTQSSLDSFGTYHGNLVNTTYGTGKFGSAFNFTGGNINMGTGAANFGTNPFTISLWFYPNAGNNLQMLVSKGFTGNTDKGFYINTDNRYNSNLNGISFGLSVGGGTYRTIVTTSAFPYTAAAWNHLVVTRSGNTTLIYLNGVLTSTANAQVAGTGNVSGDISNTGANMLLAQYGSGGLNFSGRMDGLTMWNRVVSLDEVAQLYNSGTGTQYPFVGTFSSAGNQLGMDNGTLMNGCSLTTGKIGQAFTFDGVNDYVQLPDNSLNFTGDFSVSAWINVGSVSGEKFLISNVNGNGTNLNFGWVFGLLNNQLSFGSYGNTVFSSWNTSSTLLANTWHHVLVTKKPSETPKLYINGVLSTSTLHPNSSGTNSTNPVYSSATYPNIKSAIGTYIYNNGTSLYGYWNGKIDALTAYQKELTQSEITELYNSGNGKQITATPIVQTGLVLNLDASRSSSYTGTGTTWADISGNGNNGTLVNGPIFGTASGGVITFDGVNDYVDLGTKSSLAPGTTDFTISFWINPSSWSMTYSPFFTTAITNGLWIGKNNSNFVLRTYNVADDIQYSVLPTLNTWTMVTVNRSGGIARIYYNDVMVASAANSRNYITGNSYIGTDNAGSSNCINSKLSSFYYYNRSLSQTEITQNFNATKSRFGL